MFDQGLSMVTSVDEQAAVLALVARSSLEWHRTASLVDDTASAIRIVDGDLPDLEGFDRDEVLALGRSVTDDLLESYREMITELAERSIRLATVLDDSYPENLRQIYDRPPFLFMRGALVPDDDRAVAVVGTRRASPEGLAQARQLAGDLARRGVTVLSGLARGIDTAAHEGALDAGGRTVAVFGTGIMRVYPPENERLASRVVEHGALVSQFWPGAPPTKYSFPMRNVVTSGLAVGSVVVEAEGRSGARNQARRCLEHGKRLFLVKSLVLQEPWAQKYAQHPGTTVVDSVDDVIEVVSELTEPPAKLTLG